MAVKTLTRSFAGGEITPEMFGRLDLSKFQTGLAKCLNFVVLPHGPVQNRAGFAYVLEVKSSAKKTRIIPFSFNTEQTFIIELGEQYVRFHTNGGTLLEAGKNVVSVTKANPGVMEITAHGYNNGDWLYLSGLGGMTELNGRYVKVANKTTDTFELTDLAGNNINTTGFGTFTSGGTAARVYEVATPYLEADLFDIHFVQSADVLTLVHPSHAPRELRRLSATNWQLSTISFAPTIAAPTGVTATATAGSGSIAYEYVVTSVASDGLEESLKSSSSSCNNDLTGAGAKNTVTWTNASGAVRYNVYRKLNGLYGYVGQAADGSTGFVDDNITPDVSNTPPEANNPFSGADNYPSAVGYFEQRRCFAGTNNKPQNFWATRSATESNLSYSIPTRDDDAISFRLAAREANRIRHVVPLSELLLLTSGGEVVVKAQNSDILTPTSAAPKFNSFEGANNVQPVVTGSAVLYAQDSGGRVRELRYQWDQSGYKSDDISVLAPHLFDDYTLVDMAFTKAPVKVCWAVRSDGKLLGLTYTPEHQVAAWHQHDTDGTFESVAAVKEGTRTVLYAVIKRNINNRDVRYIERQASRSFAAQEDAFFVDAGATYDGAATMSITGLHHLEGETVSILADGAVHPRKTVSGGAITLDQAASVVQVGLPITADLQTLPPSIEAAQAYGQGAKFNVNQVFMRVYESSGIFAGPAFDRLTEYKQRTDEPYGSPPRLISGSIDHMIEGDWNTDGQVCVRQSDPLPLTLLSLVSEIAVGG